MSSGDPSEPGSCAKADVPLSWCAGQPALAYAAGIGDVTCMKVLLELGANAALPNGTAGPQAIHRAAASGMCKASPLCSSLSWLCCMQLMLAVQVCPFAGNIDAAELLLEHGADINADSSAGPPLFLAAGTPPEPSLLFCL